MSNPAAPLRIPPGAKRTPWAVSHSTAFGKSSIHKPMWFKGVAWTAGFLSGSIGCIKSTSTLNGPTPMAQMSSSTFSRSLWNVPVTSKPNISTQSFFSACLSGPPMAICWIPKTLNGLCKPLDGSCEELLWICDGLAGEEACPAVMLQTPQSLGPRTVTRLVWRPRS